MALTDLQCRSAKPKEKDYKISDTGGLYLLITTTGSKLWRIKYRFGKEKTLVPGSYPKISLADAREERDWAKRLLSQGIDPQIEKQKKKLKNIEEADNTFKKVSLEWLMKQKNKWAEDYYNTVHARLKNNAFPHIGSLPIAQIEPIEVLDMLRIIEDRGAIDMASRVKQTCGQVFRYGVVTRKCSSDPTRDLKEALQKRKVEHYPALEPHELPELLSTIKKNEPNISRTTMRAVIFSLLTFARPTEIRHLIWSEVDYKNQRIIIPGVKMKKNFDLVIPLAKQTIKLLKEQHEDIKHFKTDWVFSSMQKRGVPISENTVNNAVHDLGFKGRMTAHGFRALASTSLVEELEYIDSVVDRQLAHVPKNETKRAYFRMKFIKQRIQMMQDWADYIDSFGFDIL